jgi:hypothetical protein
MNIPARAKRSTPDTLIPVEKLVISRLAKSMVEIIPKIRNNMPKNAKTVVPRQLPQFFIKFLPFQPDEATLIMANRSATQAIITAHSHI